MPRKRTKAPTEFVLDASVAVAWFFEDGADAYADAVLDALRSVPAIVPALWRQEVAGALLIAERKGRATQAKVVQFLGLLAALPIRTDIETKDRVWSDTLDLARTHELSLPDAVYLELSLRRGLPLATMDEQLRPAAKAAGVTLLRT